VSEPLGELRQIILPVEDLDRACAFLQEVLGLELRFRDADRYAAFTAGTITLALATAEEQVFPGAVGLALKTADLEGAVARLAAADVQVGAPIESEHERRATFADDDGNPFVLYQPKG
jgi:catechol 2,3-dioxygenase-like lactoylglutathione lyase family enzyme